MIDTLEAFPLTVLVKVLSLLFNVLVVDEATTLDRSIFVVTPFTFEVNCVPDVFKVFPVITLVVATTPLIVVVKVFPDTASENEVMNCLTPLEIPLIIFSK